MDKEEKSLILLTYKGKILLMLFETDPLLFNSPYVTRDHTWKFIGGDKAKGESFQQAIIKKVKVITSVSLPDVEVLSATSSGKQEKHLYFARLTDDQVNSIERGEGHLLQFFSFKEIEKLSLSETTKYFITQNRDFIQNV